MLMYAYTYASIYVVCLSNDCHCLAKETVPRRYSMCTLVMKVYTADIHIYTLYTPGTLNNHVLMDVW